MDTGTLGRASPRKMAQVTASSWPLHPQVENSTGICHTESVRTGTRTVQAHVVQGSMERRECRDKPRKHRAERPLYQSGRCQRNIYWRKPATLVSWGWEGAGAGLRKYEELSGVMVNLDRSSGYTGACHLPGPTGSLLKICSFHSSWCDSVG